ncbi:MAG TPA: carboxypeptidase regulatory-like domain-containing protein [Candidatus Angelobacter sp.]|nr:carboxypeptidase regulatory-like domain-containing protein [Candidatus Angelobacter sp.]
MLRKVAFTLWLLPLLLLATATFAQNTAKILGTVTDQSGAAVVGAKVTVKNPDAAIERTTETNSSGYYEVPALPPGKYTVQVQMTGFDTQVANNVVVEVSNNSTQDFGLKVASTNEVVTVEATAPVIETTTMTVGQTINQRTVQEIPLNGRHFVDLALLVPGTVTPPQNGFLTAPLRGQGSFAFNTAGSREDAINFMINGINLSDMVQNQVTFQPTINTVSEFKLDNSTYSAEYGRNSGSIVNIATRSGTNDFHGEVYDYLRNDFFDARNAFNRVTTSTGAPNPIAPFKRNQFGADFGGPIKKGKTFFFLSYEGLRHRQGLTTSSNVLTATQRAAVVAGGNPVSNAILGLIPVANTTIGASPVPNGFIGSATAPVNIDQGTVDINHTISDRDTLHGYYVYQADFRGEPTQGTNIPGFGDTREGHRQVFTLGETHVFNANTVNEARLGANRIHILFTPQNTTDPNSLGLASTLGPNEKFIPTFSVTDVPGLTFGDERGFPQGRGDTAFEVADTVSYVHSKHSLKFGGEARDFRNDNFNGDPGALTFTSASLAAGNVTGAARTVGNVANRINVGALDFFGMDTWKISSKLTAEVGLRYAWNMTPTEADDRYRALIPVAGVATSTIVPITQPYGQNNKNFEPRVGFTWNIFGNTVLRGGYGFQVDQPITGVVTGLTSNPKLALPISVAASSVAALSTAFNGIPASIAPVFVNPNFKNANVQSFNLNIEQQVGRTLGFMVGYFGSKGTHLEIDRNINQFGILNNASSRPFVSISLASPILGSADGAVTPVSLANSITERDSSGTSRYDALWVTANKKMSKGLQFNASYTWSHSIDENSRNNQGIVVQDSNDIFTSVGNSDFDARHRFVVNAIYDLPFKGNRYFVSGWSIAPIFSIQSGNPFNIASSSSAITGVGGTVRPDLAGTPQVKGDPLSNWFVNPAVFVAPPVGQLGVVGRNSFVGPGFTDLDLALFKNTKITERMNVQLRADAFDILNHPNYGQPSGTIGSVGVIGSTRFPTGDSGSSRQLQLALKVQF